LANSVSNNIEEELSIIEKEEALLKLLKNELEKEYLESIEEYLDNKIIDENIMNDEYMINNDKLLFDSHSLKKIIDKDKCSVEDKEINTITNS
jgi:hypothetical protein